MPDIVLNSKPQEFFERVYDTLKSYQKQLLNLTRVNSYVLRASYKVALRIAKAKKPYTVYCGETHVIGCIKDVCQEMLSEIAAHNVSEVPM